MKKIVTLAVLAVAGLGVIGGGAAYALTGTIDGTGTDSTNSVESNSWFARLLNNNTGVDFANNNPQNAGSGHVNADGNTTAGDAVTGAVGNGATLDLSVSVNNSSSSEAALGATAENGDEGSIANTGNNSTNNVTSNSTNAATVNNNTTLHLQNNVTQNAYSGNANVTNNTTGGSATTGDATNTSSTTATINVTN